MKIWDELGEDDFHKNVVIKQKKMADITFFYVLNRVAVFRGRKSRSLGTF